MGVRHNMGCGGSDSNEKQEEPVRAEAPARGCHKIRSGDTIGMFPSERGNNPAVHGLMIHSNMDDGANVSIGPEREDQLWQIKAFKHRCWGTDGTDYKSDGSKIKTGDRVMLIQLANGLALHSNTADGGPASAGPPRCDQSWIIWGEKAGETGIKVKDDMLIQFESVAQEGKFWHSNASEAGPFSIGGENADQGWNIYSNFYKEYYDCARITSDMTIAMFPSDRNNNPDTHGKMLHSNIADGGMLSVGPEREDQYWEIKSFKKSTRGTDSDSCRKPGKKIKTGDHVMLVQKNNGLALHSNTANEGGASAAEVVRADQAFKIWGEAAGEEGITVKEGMLVQFECVAQEGVFFHSNGSEGGAFSMGGENADQGWTLGARGEAFSSSSSSDWEAWDN